MDQDSFISYIKSIISNDYPNNLKILEELRSLKIPQSVSLFKLSDDQFATLQLFVSQISYSAAFKEFTKEPEREFSQEDFPEFATTAKPFLQFAVNLLTNLEGNGRKLRLLLCPFLYLVAAHSPLPGLPPLPWTSPQTIQLAYDLLAVIQDKSGDLPDLLTQDCHGLLSYLVSPYLSRERWRFCPGHCQAFIWIVAHFPISAAGEHLNLILPPSLLLSDDYLTSNQLRGLVCLRTIVPTCLRGLSQHRNTLEVVWEALQRQVYRTEPQVLRQAYPLLIQAGAALEPPQQARQRTEPSKLDEVFVRYLWSMEGEQKLKVRKIYARLMSSWIQTLGESIIRYLKRVVRIILSYIQTWEGPECHSTRLSLTALELLIEMAKERIPRHFDTIMAALVVTHAELNEHFLRFPSEASKEDDEEESASFVRENVEKQIHQCLHKLKTICPDKFEDNKEMLKQYQELATCMSL